MLQHKIIMGLTGTFGSGKSTVAHFMEELGALVIDADKIAHEALWEESPVYQDILKLFPEAGKSGELDRKKIADVIFKDAAKRKALEDLTHPYVFSRIGEEIADAEEKVVVIEVPLLFEAGFDRICDSTVTVTASKKEIEKRLLEKGFTQEQISARQAAQMPDEEKKKRAGFILDNSGTLENTRRKVEKLWKSLGSAQENQRKKK